MNTAKQLIIPALFMVIPAAMAASADKKPAEVEAFYDKHEATVENINHESGTITVKDDSGNTMVMQIHPEVSSFDSVKQGDQGKIEYLESVVVAVSPASESSSTVPAATGQSYIVRNPGVKPSGVPIETFTITATIDEINHKTRLAELTGPNGNSYRVSFPKEVPELRKIDDGDQIVVELTPMLALDIDKKG